MAAVTICSDFGAQENKVSHCFYFFPIICHEVMGLDAMIFVFWMLSFKPTLSPSSFTFLKRLFSSFSLSAISVVSSVYLRLLIFLLAILIPACASYSLAFHMLYSAYKLNKQGDNIQPWCTPFPIWNWSVVPCSVLTAASWPAYRFFRRQVTWSGITIFLRIFQFLVIHIVEGFSVVNEAALDFFFWNSLSFSMIQQMLAIWFLVPLPFLNPACTPGSSQFTYGLENFEQYFPSVWDEYNCAVVWTFLVIPFLGLEWKLTSSSPAATAEFSKFASILSAALPQCHLSGFQKAQLEFHHLH